MSTWPSENEILKRIKPYIDKNKINVIGYDEDVVSLNIPDKGKFLSINTDSWVASTDRPENLDYKSCGYRAAINSFSDLVSKQVRPSWMVVSLTIPRQAGNHVEEIVQGLNKAACEYNVDYLGGDLNSGLDLVIDVTVFGMSLNPPLKRSDAKPGEYVCWLGNPLGETSCALKILTGKYKGNKDHSLKIYANPSLSMEFLSFKATAAIDCSDGLAKTLDLLATASNVKVNLDSLLTTSQWVNNTVKENNGDLEEIILNGGEELGIVFTCTKLPENQPNLIILGKTSQGSGVYLKDRQISNQGWNSFESTL